MPEYQDPQGRYDDTSSSEPTRVVPSSNGMNNQESVPQYKDQCRDDGAVSSELPRVNGISAPNGATNARASNANKDFSSRSSSDPATSEVQGTDHDGGAAQSGSKRSVHDSSRVRGENEVVHVPIAFPVGETLDVISPDRTESTGLPGSTITPGSTVPPPSSQKIIILLMGTALICLLIIGAAVLSTICALGKCTSGNDKVSNNPVQNNPVSNNPISKSPVSNNPVSSNPVSSSTAAIHKASPPLSVENVAPTMAPSAELSREPLWPTGPNVNSSEVLTAQVNALTLSPMNISYPASSEPTPQEMALAWLIERDPIAYNDTDDGRTNELAEWRMTQRYALVTLFHATDRDASDRPYSNRSTAARWFENVDECTWNGIACNADRQVSKVDWYGRKIVGYLPDDVGLLTDLVFFGISANQIRGTLPSTIGLWTDLSVFSVFETQVTGTIPDSVANWTNITEAYFYSNGLTGTMPVGICPYVDPTANDHMLVNCPTRSGPSVECSCCTACV
jgi:hypothetical protein